MDYEAWIASVRESLAVSGERVGEHLPGVLAAVVLLAIGWLVAWLLSMVCVRLATRITRLVPSRTVAAEMREAGVESLVPKLVGGFVFWVVLLFFFAAAAEIVGLTVVTAGVSRLARYLPQILASALVILAGLVLSNLARHAAVSAAGSAGVAHGELIGRALRVAILLVAGIVALDQIGIDSTVLNTMVLVAAGTLLGGTALAFGLGAREVVANLLELHYLTQTYRAGQVIRVGDVQGRIAEFTSTAVIVETDEGRVLVPGRDFGRTVSMRLHEGEGR